MKIDPKDYELRIWYSHEPGDECFIAQAVEMPNIMAHGASAAAAAREIQIALELHLQVLAQDGIAAPPPRNPLASALGRLGGSTTSKRKRLAARANGRKGGRPRKAAAAA